MSPEALAARGERLERTAPQRPSRLPAPIARGWSAWNRAGRNNAGIAAAAIAFFAMLGLVPALTAISLIAGWLGNRHEVLTAFEQLARFLPSDTARFAIHQMAVVLEGGKREGAVAVLSAIAFGLYGLMNAAQALIAGLNLAYRLEEKRGFLRLTAMTLAMAAAATASSVVLLRVLVFVGEWSKGYHRLHAAVVSVVLLAAIGFAVLLTGQLFQRGPSRDPECMHPVLPGAITAVVLNIVFSVGFGFYAANFANFARTYGLLAQIAPIMLWLQLSAYGVLLGAAVNADIKLAGTSRPARPSEGSGRLGS